MEEERVEVVEETGKKKKRPFDLTVKIYKIVSIIIYCIWTSFFAYIILDMSFNANGGDLGQALGYVFLLIIMVGLGLIGYGIMTVIGITGLSLSIANKNNPKRIGNIIFFAIETVLSVGTFFAVIYLGTAVANKG